jgi:hypothetical protein
MSALSTTSIAAVDRPRDAGSQPRGVSGLEASR